MTSLTCEWCGYALRDTQRVAFLRDGAPVFTADLCKRCVDVALNAVLAVDPHRLTSRDLPLPGQTFDYLNG